MLTNKLCPKCGKNLVVKQGLDGLWCPSMQCGYWEDCEPTEADLNKVNPSDIFNEERLKPLRGVPMDIFTIGSEAKGRIQIQIPCSCTKAERRYLINSAIEDMEYMKKSIDEKQLDIYSSRGKKE